MELLREIFRGTKRHKYYGKSVEMYHKMKVHMDGEFPVKLIGERRPSESAEVCAYREKIWAPITMEPMAKVESSLQKIRKSADWSVRYNAEAISRKINEEEAPEMYFEKKFPNYGYLGAWLFSEVVRNYMIDANSYVVVLPLVIPKDKAEYIRPYPKVINSDLVYWVTPELAVFGEEGSAEVYWVFTVNEVTRYEKIKGEYVNTYSYSHSLGYIPAFKMRGIYVESDNLQILHRSRFYAMCPRLDEAAREYSDMQAEIVQHIHSERWEIRFPDCKTCKGTGKVMRESGEVGVKECTRCKGSGYDASPFAKLSINPNALTTAGAAIPTPPAGYLQKDTAIARLQDERIAAHIYNALSAVNFQFLAQVPQNQSGIAKEVDRDELNNTVHSVAEDLVHIMLETYRICIDMRYGVIVPDKEARAAMIPEVTVPERYDLLNTAYLMKELKEAKDSGASPAIISELQVELANKKFYNNPEVHDMVTMIYDLDPLPGYSQDDKMAMEMNGWISKEDAIISSYLASFVRRAMEEIKGFAKMSRQDKLNKLKEYAREKMGEDMDDVDIQDETYNGKNGDSSDDTDKNEDEDLVNNG